MTELRVVEVTEEHLDSVWQVRTRSFGMGGDRDEWKNTARSFIVDGRYLGVLDGGELVAAARVWPHEQWWGGRRVPMGGVAGVVVAPEYRGRGVGSLLMRAVLNLCVEKGYPLTALYPATTVLYRHLGYEFAGSRHLYTFEAADLRTLGGSGTAVRKAGRDDADLFLELAAKAHEARRSNGPLIWPHTEVESWLEDESSFAYVADDGFVVYKWKDGNLAVEELIAGSEETARALWATVGSGASIAKTVEACCPPFDPIHLMAEHEALGKSWQNRWMLRLVDAPAAFAGRGFPDGVVLEADLRIDDPELPANTGDWHLSISNGSSTLTPAEPSSDALRLGPRGLAALYAGMPLATLRGAGLTTGGAALADTALDAVFGGPAAYMLDDF
ncbi:putative acetyltransferase [Kribbella sp. VKM Ac-2569]|uniref:GNAT family N-acetyltransferase n=1 Tax=Kribbella sp. VKM Ac-2569 TaxID=2512220 RepID=UPI0010EDA33E|nr:GNAT family N-acetyltransferase [Kribbella sp. VKM Ac-2569]RZT11862.1 putative acetyltransferase [Kribbella sp. VKM Ac-2569]